MKRIIKTVIALVMTANAAWAADNSIKTIVTSPDGRLKVTAECSGGMTWSIDYDGMTVTEPSAVGITIGGKEVIAGKASASKMTAVDKTENVFYAKRSEIRDRYNTVTLSFKTGAKVELRAYDGFAAYRILSGVKKAATVDRETAEFRFSSDCEAFVPYVNDNRSGERWCYSFESYYDEQCLSEMFDDSLSITPMAVTVLPRSMKWRSAMWKKAPRRPAR